MRHLIIILFALSLCTTVLGQVVKTEYFFDKDPGVGKGTTISSNQGLNISDSFTIPLANLTVGFHTLKVRSQDAQGHWSHTLSHTFHLFSGRAGTVAASEYFIDTDPGHGMATPITAAPGSDSSIRFAVPLSNVGLGFHTLFVRTKDDAGRWSLTQQHVFFNNAGDSANITSLEYYFTGNGQTSPTLTFTDFTPASLIDLDFIADVSQLEGNREYDMHIWAVASNGTKSEVLIKKVKVCNEQPAKAAFDFIPLGTQVSFIDSSVGVSKYEWDFGDGTIDSVSNPVHNYSTGGTYNVRLVVSNFCNSDTATEVISALFLQSISPSVGGNTGSVTISVQGSGFSKGSIIKLINNNFEITQDTVFVNEEGSIINAILNLNGNTPGIYDVIVEANGNSDTLYSAFVIQNGEIPNLFVNLVGRDVIRGGQQQTYLVNFGNNGNIDALAVPLWISGLPNNGTWHINAKIDTLDEESQPTPIDFVTDDSTKAISLIISRIPAKSNFSVELQLLTPVGLDTINITTWLSAPLINENESSETGRLTEESPSFKCMEALIDKAVSEVTDKLIPKKCLNEATGLLYETLKQFTHGDAFDPTSPEFFSAYKKHLAKTAKTISTCVVDVFGGRYRAFYRAFLKRLYILEGKRSEYIEDAKTVKDCAITIGRAYFKNEKLIRSVFSLDPNEKCGLTTKTHNNYVNAVFSFNYSIYFENVDSATAPAQEVIITDTLDKSKFDFTTFKLQSFGFGDSISISTPSGLQFYSTNTLLKRPGKTDLLVRIDAKLDTATGVVKWRFLSLDPKTRELTADPLDGFLPPNKAPREGEGFVSYSIMPKPDLPHGTEIRNKAAIYFDNNAPIITNEFLNTIDKIEPVSRVSSLPAEVQDTTFTVKWGGTDDGAGIRSYDVYYAVNNDSFRLWQYDVSATEGSFTGQKDSTYRFYSIAKDYAGNIEEAKTTAETSTRITGVITAVPNVPTSAFAFRSYPNPTDNSVWLEFTLPVAQQVRIAITDMTGKHLGIISNKQFAPGTHKLFYNLQHLQAGFYIGELQSKRYRQSIRIFKR